ncbi:hypothetical protein AA13595_1324 [Gluconacetobacter johannae DSM 13595]|uniref:Phage protein n=1 Tax=Gluconacetobacter johannae TaxID=112140 RepID=A0A7W4J8Q9_9PROT|nr:hypothetical protein [Gluconacetobacter johannae]MBB2176770.1 hypothetical protein [Gluconacetobacter johannae]GBQ84105.1 hypothetical protein AA13595_1324 [Gluconacetobacter johannae DSM 13595]
MSLDWGSLVLGPCETIFGEPVTWQSSQGGAPVQATGVFDEGYKGLEIIGGDDGMAPTHVTSSLPRLGVRLSQFPAAAAQGDTLVIRGISYAIREIQPDSHGGARIELNIGATNYDPLSG